MKWAVLGWDGVSCRPAAGGQGIGWAACGRGKLVWVCLCPVGMVLAGHDRPRSGHPSGQAVPALHPAGFIPQAPALLMQRHLAFDAPASRYTLKECLLPSFLLFRTSRLWWRSLKTSCCSCMRAGQTPSGSGAGGWWAEGLRGRLAVEESMAAGAACMSVASWLAPGKERNCATEEGYNHAAHAGHAAAARGSCFAGVRLLASTCCIGPSPNAAQPSSIPAQSVLALHPHLALPTLFSSHLSTTGWKTRRARHLLRPP